MWLKSHKWISIPYTKYEIRRELRVRESRHTCMVFDKKYFDSDTCKFDGDKISTIYSQSLQNVCSDYDDLYYLTRYIRIYKHQSKAWFVPKDDDFDDEG
jgi:hypothetical protein